MLRKFIGLATIGCLCFCACSSDIDSAGSTEDSMINNVALSDTNAFLKLALWNGIDSLGIPRYFQVAAEKGVFVYDPYTRDNLRCKSPALSMDDHTLFFDELETIYQEGKLVDGVCGKAVSLADGQVAPLGVNLIDSMKVGTVEFWFKPGKEFYKKKARTLLGNDGARVHFFYKDGELIFQKNHHNQHYFVKNKAELDSGWNLIAGQWGDGYMSLWLNGKLVVKEEHELGYAPATRGIPYENLFVIGYKSYCCMEGVNQFEGMTTAGAFDQFRISNITRYDINDTAVVDTSVVDTLLLDTATVDTVPADTIPADTTVKDTSVVDTAAQDTGVVSEPLWEYFSMYGIETYFEKAPLPQTSPYKPNACEAPALVMDDSTKFMDELETVYKEGTLVDGVCGKALSLKDGEVAPLGINMIDSMKAGTVEFWFRPGEDFGKKSIRTILGNDDSRMQILYKNGELVFQKNHADQHYFVKDSVTFNNDWNLIAAQWGDGYMSIWLNGKMVASVAHEYGYVPSTRNRVLENLLVIGFKSACCMEGIEVGEALTTSGAYDQLRISNVPRYKVENETSFDHEYIGAIDTLFAGDSVARPIIIDTLVAKDTIARPIAADTAGLPVVVDTTSMQ